MLQVVLPNHSKLRTLPIYLQQEMIGVNKMPKSPGGGWRALEDIEKTKKLIARYCYFLDTLQMEEAADCFTDNAAGDWGPLGRYEGKQAIATFLKDTVPPTVSMMQYQRLNTVVEVEGEKATATWYLFGPFTYVTLRGNTAAWVQGKCENELAKEHGKWRFSSLRFSFNFNTPYEDGWLKTPMMEP